VKVVGTKVQEDIFKALVERAKAEGVKVSEVVRRAIMMYLGRSTPSDLETKVKMIEEELTLLKERVSSLESKLSQVITNQSQPTKKVTAMDILKKEGFIDERDLYGRVRNPKGLISSLEKQGARVFEVKDSRIIVDPEFFNLLMSKLENISTSKESELKKVLNEREYKLLEILREGGYIFFDATTKKWMLVK
jgi:Ribbon-helix-helix protein, copG family.